jgi:hypothetical protein
MHHDRPLPSPGPARIVEFIKRLSESSLVKLSRLLKEDQTIMKKLKDLDMDDLKLWIEDETK